MTNILNLLGPVMLGVAFAGFLLFAKRVLRIPLPGWFIPMGAAFAMMAGHLYIEYTWFNRFSAQLPAHVHVADTLTTSGPFEPWTYARPRINRFSAVDANAIRVNPAHPDIVIGEVILVERYVPTATIGQIADCKGTRTADMPADPVFGSDGLPQGLVWIDRTADNPVLATMCRLAQEKAPK